jgi:hypothetical protein
MKESIDFDGDGFDSLAPHTFVPIPSDTYAALGVELVALDARSVGTNLWTHSPPIGAWQTGFSSPPGPYSFVFDQPVASFGLFANDVEGAVTVTVHTNEGIETFNLPSQGGAAVSTFHGYVAVGNAINRIDFSSGDFHIIDDVQFSRTINLEPVEHTFSTTGTIFIDPLLTGLTSVSGSFTYDNGIVPFGTTTGGSAFGSTIYRALSNLSGMANGNSFSDPQGSIIVGDDKFSNISPPADIVRVNWDPPGDASLSGFSFAGMSLVNVQFRWIEGQSGIFFDFLEDQSLPAILPPTTSGELRLFFVDGAGGLHFASYNVTVVPVIPDNSDIFFSGPLAVVRFDLGGGVYSGVPTGTNFYGAINLLTSDGFITDGTTHSSLSCCVTTPHRGVDV